MLTAQDFCIQAYLYVAENYVQLIVNYYTQILDIVNNFNSCSGYINIHVQNTVLSQLWQNNQYVRFCGINS